MNLIRIQGDLHLFISILFIRPAELVVWPQMAGITLSPHGLQLGLLLSMLPPDAI